MKTILAANFTPAHRTVHDCDWLTVHDGETQENKDSAEGMGLFFHGQRHNDPNGSSAHYGCDVDSVVRYVLEENVAWAAPFANHNGIHVEHAGRAAQTTRDWNDVYSRKMLKDVSAPLFADLARRYEIPVRFCRAVDLAAGKRGITTHWEITKAFSAGHGHTDPGVYFPMEEFLGWVKAIHNGAGKSQVEVPPTLRYGDAGWRVKQLQRLLNFPTSHNITVDGHFTTATLQRVKAFQGNHHLRPDGVVGANTWAALWATRYHDAAKVVGEPVPVSEPEQHAARASRDADGFGITCSVGGFAVPGSPS